jgi:hypothetical protein
MTDVTADVLARIDGALTDYGYIDFGETGSSMRWRPEPPPEPEDQGDEEDGALIPLRPGLMIAVHFRDTRHGWNICVRAEARRADQLPGLARDMKARYARQPGLHPRPASHCEECNPRGNPGPLAVDGRAYQRRIKSRRKRRWRS